MSSQSNLILVVIMGAGIVFFLDIFQLEALEDGVKNIVPNNDTAQLQQAIDVYNKVKDSVVRIDIVFQEKNEKITVNDEPLKGSFIQAFGAGFVYDGLGRIVTNYHVIEDNTKLVVTLANGNRYSGEVIGVDPVNDLAVVQIDNSSSSKENLRPLPIADPSTIRIGQPVIAIGSPFDYSNSLSQGIVSQIDRTRTDLLTGSVFVGGYIQTDTAITHGNSGGPLLNMNGEVVGVNDWIEIDPDTGTQVPGLGFAISSGIIKKVIPQLISEGKYSYPWIGIGIEDIGPFDAKKYGLNETNGVIVRWVRTGSPADLSGIMYDDVLLRADKVVIKEKSDIVKYLGSKIPGDIISLDIVRSDGLKHNILVKIGALGNLTESY